MQLILIHLDSPEARPKYALLSKKQQSDAYICADWSQIKPLCRGRRVVLLIPNTEVSLNLLNLPASSAKQLKQAIPYALEESLADDIEDMHFVSQQLDDDTRVASIKRERLEIWLATLKKQHISPTYILPAFTALPFAANSWTAHYHHSQISLRFDALSGLELPESLLSEVYESNQKQYPATELLTNLGTDEIPENLQTLKIHSEAQSLKPSYQGITSAFPLNLMAGYVRDYQASSINWSLWRPVLALAASLGAIWLGSMAWQNQQLKQQQQQLDSALESVFKQSFPGQRVVDASAQMSSELSKLQKNTGTNLESPLPMLAQITPVLKAFKAIELREVKYLDQQVKLTVSAANLSQLETFKKKATENNDIEISIESSSTSADKVEATIILVKAIS